MNSHPIDEAAKIVGSETKLAELLGVTKAAVNQWKLPEREVPAKHCPEIEKLTDGKVRCEDLNQSVDWDYVRAHSAPHEEHPIPEEARQ